MFDDIFDSLNNDMSGKPWYECELNKVSVKKGDEIKYQDREYTIDGIVKDMQDHDGNILDPQVRIIDNESERNALAPLDVFKELISNGEITSNDGTDLSADFSDMDSGENEKSKDYGELVHEDGDYKIYKSSEEDGVFDLDINGETSSFGSLDGAKKYIESDKKMREDGFDDMGKYVKYKNDISDKERESRESAEKVKEDEETAKRTNLYDFGDQYTPMQKGKMIRDINSNVKIDGKIKSIKDAIEEFAKSGELELSSYETNKIKDPSRRRYNRMNQAEQDEHEEKIQEGGKKTIYMVNGYNLGGTAYNYANHLKDNNVFSSDKNIEEQSGKEDTQHSYQKDKRGGEYYTDSNGNKVYKKKSITDKIAFDMIHDEQGNIVGLDKNPKKGRDAVPERSDSDEANFVERGKELFFVHDDQGQIVDTSYEKQPPVDFSRVQDGNYQKGTRDGEFMVDEKGQKHYKKHAVKESLIGLQAILTKTSMTDNFQIDLIREGLKELAPAVLKSGEADMLFVYQAIKGTLDKMQKDNMIAQEERSYSQVDLRTMQEY